MIKTKIRQNPFVWHEWFAWRPVFILECELDGPDMISQWAWLETIWRKGSSSWGGWSYDYSLTEPTND